MIDAVIDRSNVTGLILAGGRATRIGGNDKGLIEVAGQSMVRRIVSQLTGQVGSIMINANRNFDEYEALGHPVIRDRLADYQGPLAGMLSGLESIDTDWMLTTPCDGPYVDKHYGSAMIAAAVRDEVRLCVARSDERLQPVYCLVHRCLASSLKAYLESGDRKIDRWFAQHRFAEVVFEPGSPMFVNINTPEQFAEIEADLSS